MKIRTKYLLFVTSYFFCQRLHARIIRGPNFYHERTESGSDDPSDTSRPKSVARNKLRLVAPIDRSFFGGMLAARYELYSENYQQSSTAESRKVTMLGFTYIPHFDEGPSSWFLTYGFYSDFVQAPMHETTVGFNLRNTPFYFSLTESADVDVFVAPYLRRFPWGYRYMPVLMYHASFSEGWYLKTDVPTNLFIGRMSDDQKWAVEIAAYLHTINYPWVDQAADSGWIDGYTINYNVGAKRQIYGVLYGTFYAGVQAARYWYTTKSDRDVAEQRTEFAPIAMVGLETLFSVK